MSLAPSVAAGQALEVGAALRARPATEPLAEAIIEAMAAHYRGGPDRFAIALVTENPGLRGEYLKTFESLEQVLAQAIAGRTGADPRADLAPRVLAAAVAAAARVAAEHWQQADASNSFADVLREALARLAPALGG